MTSMRNYVHPKLAAAHANEPDHRLISIPRYCSRRVVVRSMPLSASTVSTALARSSSEM
jgi:hypothetical protein